MHLAEALLDYDEEVRCWRFVHARTAERTIGPEVEGTAATSGVRYLERMATHRASFFPFLWRARAELWDARAAAGRAEAERRSATCVRAEPRGVADCRSGG